MIVYRLTRSKFKHDISGTGAKMAGGRWNSIGIPVLYTAESRALAALEIAVHTPLNIVPEDYVMVTIFIPDKVDIEEILTKDLPRDWKSFPENRYTQSVGNKFFMESNNLALKVPSAIIQGDHNILLNPNHKDFIKVKMLSSAPFEFDQRLFIKGAEA